MTRRRWLLLFLFAVVLALAAVGADRHNCPALIRAGETVVACK